MSKYPGESCAYHEAGHAFVAYKTKTMTVTEISLEGYTKADDTAETTYFDKLCFFLAGEIVEFQFVGTEGNSGRDRRMTEDLLFLISGDRAKQYKAWQSAIMLINFWIKEEGSHEKIELITEALLKKGIVYQDEFEAIMAL